MRECAERTLKTKTSLDVEKINNSEILKPTRLCEEGLLFRFSVLERNVLRFCGFRQYFARFCGF